MKINLTSCLNLNGKPVHLKHVPESHFSETSSQRPLGLWNTQKYMLIYFLSVRGFHCSKNNSCLDYTWLMWHFHYCAAMLCWRIHQWDSSWGHYWCGEVDQILPRTPKILGLALFLRIPVVGVWGVRDGPLLKQVQCVCTIGNSTHPSVRKLWLADRQTHWAPVQLAAPHIFGLRCQCIHTHTHTHTRT